MSTYRIRYIHGNNYHYGEGVYDSFEQAEMSLYKQGYRRITESGGTWYHPSMPSRLAVVIEGVAS